MTALNLFSHTTHERLQDAFICYLVDCASQPDRDLQKCGLEFVRTLFQAGASDGTEGVPVLGPDGEPMDLYVGPCKVSGVCKPNCQRAKIDVDFQAKVDGKTVTFLIENKTDTEAHSDQLKRYLDFIIKEQKSDLIKPVYLKTGYVFSDERARVKCNKYSMFEAEDMKNFLDGQEATQKDEILRQYAEYLSDRIKTRDDNLEKWDLNQNPVQWEFMLKLRKTLEDAAGEWQCFIPKKLSGLLKDDDIWKEKRLVRKTEHGMWMQYCFLKHLHWRIDSGKSLRLRIEHCNAGLDFNEVQEEYRSRFKETLEKEGLYPGNLGGGPYVSTVGSIKTTKFQGMELSEFLERVKRVHIGFLERIS